MIRKTNKNCFFITTHSTLKNNTHLKQKYIELAPGDSNSPPLLFQCGCDLMLHNVVISQEAGNFLKPTITKATEMHSLVGVKNMQIASPTNRVRTFHKMRCPGYDNKHQVVLLQF